MTLALPFTPDAPAIVPRYYQAEAADALWSGMRTESPCAVLPTGAGKSLVIAEVCKRSLAFGGRVMVLQPSKELIQQNAEECQRLMPGVDVGLYSAGLNKRHTDHDIVFAGIQSCFDKAHLFGNRHIVLIDETHLLPADGEGRFRTFLRDLKALCPHVRLAGLTATPFRTGTGALCGPQNLLTKVVYTASVSRLMQEGYLCQVVNRPMKSELDTSGLKVLARTHEFDAHDAERLFNTDDNVSAAVSEIITKAADRRSVLLFCSGVKHAEHVADELASQSGERVGLVVGNTMPLERAETLRRFKAGELRWLCNCDVLTTGFNSRNIDCIVMLRATASPGLFAQCVGRGFRTHESKSNCCLLDFGENIKRHGPIDADNYGIPPVKEKKDKLGGMPSKECPACGEAIPISAKECPECGFCYPEKPKHDSRADTESALLQSQVEPTEWVVESVTMQRHQGREGKTDTLRINYTCQPADGGGNLARKTISEWCCLNHDGFAKRKAMQWWRERSKAQLTEEDAIEEALSLWERGAVAVANRIWTVPDGKFTRIVRQELDEVPDEWADEQEVAEAARDEWNAPVVAFGTEVPF